MREVGDLTKLTQLKGLELDKNVIVTLKGEHLPESIERINLSGNQISEVPELRTLGNLQNVNLSKNKLVTVRWSNFPEQIEYVNLSDNQITEVGEDVSQLKALRTIVLSDNKITHVSWESLPPVIEWVYLDGNQIREIPDVQLPETLAVLNLEGNKITRVNTVTPYMTGRYELDFNKITHIDKSCFETQDQYKFLSEYPFPTDHLLQPPKEVLERGLGAVVEYFSHRLVSHCSHRLVTYVVCNKKDKDVFCKYDAHTIPK